MHAAVHLVLRDADPAGIVTATRDNWTGRAYGMGVSDFAVMRDLLRGAGVYVLIGVTDEDDGDLPVIYIGEAEAVSERLRPGHHQLSRTDVTWHRVVIFVSQADDLHKGHVRWLEAQLVRRAREVARWRVLNGPDPAIPRLPEFDEVFVGSFLANMLVLYPLLGVDAFAAPATRKTGGGEPEMASTELELLFGGEAIACGEPTDSGFVIKAGSLVRKQAFDSIANRRPAALRQLWLENGALVERDDDWWSLERDVSTSSSSTAAAAVLGRSASGPKEWRLRAGRGELTPALSG